MNDVNRQLVLARRPVGAVEDSDFELRETAVPEPGPGEFLVRVLWISFDPAQRGWLNDVRSYVAPVGIGEVMRAGPSARWSHRTTTISRWATSCRARLGGRTGSSPTALA